MNWFLDMCIILYYASDTGEKKEEKTKEFVNKKGGNKFLVCYYILEDNLPKWIVRQNQILKEIKMKISNPSYEIGSSDEEKVLLEKDKVTAKKILMQYAVSKEKDKFISRLEISHVLIRKRINFFITNLLDKKVIPILEINQELKSCILTFVNNNHSDAKTLASAVQQHNTEELTIMTGDKTDWTKGNLELAIPEYSPIAKKYPKIPEIRYIQDNF